MSIETNVAAVKARIEEACRRAGRQPEEVTLIGVTKTHPVERMRALIDSGITEIGENKAQELRDKHPELDRLVDWHFIGHLQRNKVKYVIDKVVMIHSVDSLSLAREISKRAVRAGRRMTILVEVNVSGEASKFGLTPQQVGPFITEIADLPGVKVDGLMTMAPHTENPEETRPVFRGLKSLFDELIEQGYDLHVLSMGMSNDYTVAVEEGATHVRVGSALLGERDYSE